MAEIFHAAVHGAAASFYTSAQCAAWSPAPDPARPFFERRGFRLDARQEVVRRGVVLHNYRMRLELSD